MLAKVYGFGSYFKGAEAYNDIDILIVHNSTSRKSCLEAISLKKGLMAKVGKASITMLSKSEEAELKFISKASAKYLLSYNGINLCDVISIIETMKPTDR